MVSFTKKSVQTKFGRVYVSFVSTLSSQQGSAFVFMWLKWARFKRYWRPVAPETMQQRRLSRIRGKPKIHNIKMDLTKRYFYLNEPGNVWTFCKCQSLFGLFKHDARDKSITSCFKFRYLTSSMQNALSKSCLEY